MDSSVKGFHIEKINEKQYFVLNSDNNDLSYSTLFLCPIARIESVKNQYFDEHGIDIFLKTPVLELDSSPYFNGIVENIDFSDDDYFKRLDFYNHYVLPLYWCNNNKENEDDEKRCSMCFGNFEIGLDYYLCVKCDNIYHKECVESPIEIKHVSHPNHSLKLYCFRDLMDCVYCEKPKGFLAYQCVLCNLSIDPVCALKSIPLVIDKPKRHDHPLTFFTRKTFLDCNVCGLIKKTHPTYICLNCDFVAHRDCANFPSIIRISRHQHRISYDSSLPSGKWFCGVCRKNVDNGYGAYTCKKCDGYVVHSRCALRKDIWDGKELESIPEEDDIEKVLDPFEKISDGIIRHFCHDHNLKLEIYGEVYDENKICDACVLPIYDGKFYSCMECDFILHDKCANAPRKIRHPLHPNPLTLKVMDITCNDHGFVSCKVCWRYSSGFIYEYKTERICFRLDMRCASISEPFDYQGHEHPLYLALDPQEKYSCKICRSLDDKTLLNCIECNFIICMECVTLPYMVRYKHDQHFLTLDYNKKETRIESDWCEICEKMLFSEERRFYKCEKCCVTLHIKCLFGEDMYMKPNDIIKMEGIEVQIFSNDSLSRPICCYCHQRSEDKLLFKIHNNMIFCSMAHVHRYITKSIKKIR